jgi:hypothetical protein
MPGRTEDQEAAPEQPGQQAPGVQVLQVKVTLVAQTTRQIILREAVVVLGPLALTAQEQGAPHRVVQVATATNPAFRVRPRITAGAGADASTLEVARRAPAASGVVEQARLQQARQASRAPQTRVVAVVAAQATVV